MRLIDADELFFYMTDSIEQQKAEEARDEAPTVDAVPVLYIKETIAWAKENGSVEYADYLSHLLSAWAERKEE